MSKNWRSILLAIGIFVSGGLAALASSNACAPAEPAAEPEPEPSPDVPPEAPAGDSTKGAG